MPLPPASLLFAGSAVTLLLSLILGYGLSTGPKGILAEAMGLAFFGMFSASMTFLLGGIMLAI